MYKELKDVFSEESLNGLYNWCLEQASDRYRGLLSEEQIDKLNSIDFPWGYYEEELDKLGYHWQKNNPNGKRWSSNGSV